jgi:phage/plasmid-associated DNA primase
MTNPRPGPAAVRRGPLAGFIDFDTVNRAALPALPDLLARWLPGGKRRGREYLVRNPRRADAHPGSFSINVKTGRWADFASGDCGGDVISLAAFLAGISQYEAAAKLADMFGVGHGMDADPMFEPLHGNQKSQKRRSPTNAGGRGDRRTVNNQPEYDQPAIAVETSSDAAASAEAARERAETILWVRGQFANADPLSGTPGERYLVEQRHLRRPWPEALQWNQAYRWRPGETHRPCLLAAVTNAEGDIVAVQSTEIDPATGAKSSRTDKPRMSRGPVHEGAVYLGTAGETPQVLVIGEGVETVLSRRQIGPCDAYACLGAVRFIAPKPHHRRIEILADTNSRADCRRLARDYARLGQAVYVVTVPDALGPKGDLNDALQELGEAAVAMAVEDAERFTLAPSPEKLSDFELQIGSDVEIGRQIIDKLEEIYGPVVIDEGRIWRFDRTHWAALDDDHLVRFVHRADGATYLSGGSVSTVRLNKSRVASIIDAALRYRHQADYFKNPPRGINCQNGFIEIDDNGRPTLRPHTRQWRQRHVVCGQWSGAIVPAARATNSLFGKFIADTVTPRVDEDDDSKKDREAALQDASAKTRLLGEIMGCAALGYGTRLRQPKAIITYSYDGNTGKSTYLALLRRLSNPEAIASVPPSKFGDEKYAYSLIGKTLNTSDELSERALQAEVFKLMVTGQPVPARNVYQSAVSFVPVALQVFAANRLPSFRGGVDGGVVRRLLPIGFDHVVATGDIDEELVGKIIRNEPDLLLNFTVDGACRLIRQRGFTIPASSQALSDEWLRQADPLRAWAAARLEVTAHENIIKLDELYADFRSWAEKRRLNPQYMPSNISFGIRLRHVPRLKFGRSNGTVVRNAKLRPQDA